VSNGGSPFDQLSGAIFPRNITQDLLIGGQSTASATFHVYGSALAGTQPVASISGNTAQAALIIDNKGKGDLFTASSSGMSRFTLQQNGGLVVGNGAGHRSGFAND